MSQTSPVQAAVAVAAKDTSSPLIDFKELSNDIFLYEPPKTSQVVNRTASTIPPPDTIMIYSWAGGAPRHVNKYADGYKKLYPTARIIVVLTRFKGLLNKSVEWQRESMRPAIEALHAGEKSVHSTGRILIQALSNGGGLMLESTAQLYRKDHFQPLPYNLLVFDSAPGGGSTFKELPRWTAATSAGVKAAIPWLPDPIVSAMCFVWCFFALGLPVLFGFEARPAVARRNLNDENLLKNAGGRLYVYSEADKLIAWDAVEEHAAEAREKGCRVLLEKWRDSEHVAHLRKDPVRYWDTIQKAWAMEMERERERERERESTN